MWSRPGINETVETLRLLSLPDDASGQRVLDIGVRDGYFSFELERRGAEVLAIDYLDPSETGFPVAKELLGSAVEYRVDNVYRLDPDEHGSFDIALFLGVLYHLRDPLLALDRIWDVCNDDALLVVETQLIDEAFMRADGTFAPLDAELRDVSLMQFYPDDTLHGDPTNYWAPNLTALRALVHTAGFVVEKAEAIGSRGLVHARKVKDPARLYQRRLEKSTLREAAAAVHADVSVAADPEARAWSPRRRPSRGPSRRRSSASSTISRSCTTRRSRCRASWRGHARDIEALEAPCRARGAADRPRAAAAARRAASARPRRGATSSASVVEPDALRVLGHQRRPAEADARRVLGQSRPRRRPGARA